MLTKLLAAVDALSDLLLWLAVLLLAGLVAVNAAEVVARYLLNSPTIWAYDLATLLNGGLFTLGLAYTLRVGGHVRIDVFAARLPARLQRALVAGFLLLFLLPSLALMIGVAVEETLAAFASGERLLSAWEPPLWPGYLSIAVGLAALLLQTLATGVRSLTQPGDPLSPRGEGAAERGPS